MERTTTRTARPSSSLNDFRRNSEGAPSGATHASESFISSYTSHYNRELKRCLISIKFVTLYDKPELANITMEEVFDTIEQVQLASLHVRDQSTMLLRGTESGTLNLIPATPESIAWFRGLMTK